MVSRHDIQLAENLRLWRSIDFTEVMLLVGLLIGAKLLNLW